MWQNSAKEIVPRDLNQSFQKFGPASEPAIIEHYQQRITQLELALASVTKKHMGQQNLMLEKDQSIQSLRDAVHRLENNIQTDQFQEIEEAGMRGPPDAHLHSQQWKLVTPFFSPTPILPSRPLGIPDAPRLPTPIRQEIDTASEIEMIKQQLLNINMHLEYLNLPTHVQQPPGHAQQHAGQSLPPTDATASLMLAVAEELKHSRISKDIKFTSYKDITDDTPVVFVLKDWKRTFHLLRMQPTVAAIVDKILPGGNLHRWYRSQCTHRDARGKIQEHELIDNWTWERFESALLSSQLHKEPDYADIRKQFDNFKCTPFPLIADIASFLADFENLVQTLRVNDMLDDYPETRLAQKLFDDLPDHVRRAIYIMPGATPVDPKDPTRRRNYATTKADLLLFIKTDYGKHALQCAYDAHTQTLARTVAGAAATRDTVKHTIRRHIGTIGQFRISILPMSTGQTDTIDHNTKIDRITKRLQELKAVDHTFDFKEYTNKNNKQAFLIVHDSEAHLQSVSNDHILLSIGIQASPIVRITARPISPTTNQTVGAATNMTWPNQTDMHTDVSRANTATDVHVSSPVPSVSTSESARVHQGFTPLVPPSSKGLLPQLRHTSVCIISPPSVRSF